MALPPSLSQDASSNNRVRATVLRTLFAILIAALIVQIKIDFIDSYLFDLFVRTNPSKSSSEKIELIFITPETVAKLNGTPQAQQHALLLEKIKADQPLAIFYDFDLSKVTGSASDMQKWSLLAAETKNIYTASKDLPMKGEAIVQLPKPLDIIKSVPAPKTADRVNFGKDGVTRRAMLSYQGEPMLQPLLASLVRPEAMDFHNTQGVFNFIDTDQIFIDYRPKGFYPRHEFTAVTSENFKPGSFTGKIVLIGQDLAIDESEYLMTPYSRESTAMTRLEMQANVIDTLIKNSAPTRAPTWLNWFLVAIVAVVTIHVVLAMKPLKGLIILGGCFFLVCLVGFGFFWSANLWVSITHPMLTIFLCYYFFIPYRLIIENRRSWEYYQKNQLLKQVEELKGNFISMMSHDLKTPIARIQGMTDVISTDNSPLSSQQREALDSIRHSADDLLKFINAILNYGRIESEGVQLQLQAKDINSLIGEVVRKNEFLAKVKKIQIIAELEPLFPIQLDPNLMKQVLTNLVENAIKYSPEETKILITSEERNNKVIIQVADQGFGIPADELANIFMKFFRSKNAKSSPIKGSGLGLYLAKYFTELHQGTIFVESTYGQGSTFTVELPLKQG